MCFKFFVFYYFLIACLLLFLILFKFFSFLYFSKFFSLKSLVLSRIAALLFTIYWVCHLSFSFCLSYSYSCMFYSSRKVLNFIGLEKNLFLNEILPFLKFFPLTFIFSILLKENWMLCSGSFCNLKGFLLYGNHWFSYLLDRWQFFGFTF